MSPTSEELLLFRAKAQVLFYWVCLLWGIHALNWAVFQGRLNWLLGIHPRDILGLPSIITSPLLHGEGDHLLGNTMGLIPLAGFVLLQGTDVFYSVSIVAALISGLGTWCFGRTVQYPDAYIGASGVIFGYLGFLLIYGFVSGNLLAFLLAIGAAFWHGRRITGTSQAPSQILPGSQGAWISHLFGFMGGIVAAYWLGYLQLKDSGL